MNLSVLDGSTVDVTDGVFGREYNQSLVHQSVTGFLAGARLGTKAQKTRGQKSGGGRKPLASKRHRSCSCRNNQESDLARRRMYFCF